MMPQSLILNFHPIIYIFLNNFFLMLKKKSKNCIIYPGPRRPVPDVCRILCSNVRGLAGNLSDPTVALSQYDILLGSKSLVSDMRHVSEVLVPSFGHPVLMCLGKMPRAHGMAAYV